MDLRKVMKEEIDMHASKCAYRQAWVTLYNMTKLQNWSSRECTCGQKEAGNQYLREVYLAARGS